MNKKARNRKALNRCLHNIAKSIAKSFEIKPIPLDFLIKNINLPNKENEEQYEWKILNK